MHKEKKNKASKNSILRNMAPVNLDKLIFEAQLQHKVLQVRDLTDTTYVLRFTRNNMKFVPGQHIVLGIPGDNQTREYSIYSSVDQDFLEVIIREVEDGIVSRKLHRVKEGDFVYADGPFGFFSLDEKILPERKYLFVATGTGIAPFHCMIGSYPSFDFKLLHGVRYAEEAYEKSLYNPENYKLCTSGDTKGNYHGRVTDYLKSHEIDSDTLVYLCGNCEMIYEVYDLLTSKGLDSDQIRTEVYF